MRKVEIEKLYKENVNLIRKRAWHYARKYRFDVEELISEGSSLFMKAVQRYEKRENTKFTSFFWRVLDNGMKDYIKRTPQVIEFKERGVLDPHFNPTEHLMFREKVRQLSHEARHVAMIFLEGPAEALGLIGNEPPRIVRGLVTRYLAKQGVGKNRAYRILKELRQSF